MSQGELATLARNMSGLLLHLRDFIADALSKEGEEREQAFAAARQQAYDVVYLEYIPADALEIRGVTGYDLPDFSARPEEELRQLVWSVSWLALDLAQHLSFATEAMDPAYRPAAYQQALALAKDLADYPVADVRDVSSTPGVAFFGERGLESWSQ
jgi:hypothetical protein